MSDKQTKVVSIDIHDYSAVWITKLVETRIQEMRLEGWHYADSFVVDCTPTCDSAKDHTHIFLVFCK